MCEVGKRVSTGSIEIYYITIYQELAVYKAAGLSYILQAASYKRCLTSLQFKLTKSVVKSLLPSAVSS